MNPYKLLIDAHKVYVNPTLDLIKNQADLDEVCYYRLIRYPTNDHQLWILLNNDPLDWDAISSLNLNKKLISNLQLAKDNGDQDYLDYVKLQQPALKPKIVLKLKKSIIEPQICQLFNCEELTAIQLKRLINQYISEHQLQLDNEVMMDQVLNTVIKDNQSKLHIFELHRAFNRIYF